MVESLPLENLSLNDLNKKIQCPNCFEQYVVPRIFPSLHHRCKRCTMRELCGASNDNKVPSGSAPSSRVFCKGWKDGFDTAIVSASKPLMRVVEARCVPCNMAASNCSFPMEMFEDLTREDAAVMETCPNNSLIFQDEVCINIWFFKFQNSILV